MTERSAGTGAWRHRLTGLAATAALWAVVSPAAPAAPGVRAAADRAVDLAEVLSPATESALRALLADLEAATGAQVAVLTIPSLAGEPIESYALRVAESWGLGSRERDDGVLLLLAIADRRTRIEVGYGLEGVMPDIVAGRIIRDSMVPHFRRGDYEAGVLAGARAIAQRLAPDAAEAETGGPAEAPAVAAAAAPAVNWDHLGAWVAFLLVMPWIGLLFALFAEENETRGIIFGALLLPLMLGGSLALDELASFPPDSGAFLLGGLAVLAVTSTLFWWLHLRLRRRPEARARWRAGLDRVADGRAALTAAGKLGLPVSKTPPGVARWLRWVLVALVYLALGAWIFRCWSVGYAIFYVHNLLWLIVIYRAALHPSPSSASSASWSWRSSTRASSHTRSRSRGSTSRSGSGFRPGGGSFGGGGASGSW